VGRTVGGGRRPTCGGVSSSACCRRGFDSACGVGAEAAGVTTGAGGRGLLPWTVLRFCAGGGTHPPWARLLRPVSQRRAAGMGRRREWCRVGRSQQFDCGPMNRAGLTANQQTAMLADRYTQRAEAYEALWSPIIRPVGERLIARLPLTAETSHVIDVGTGAGALLPAIQRAASSAVIVGIDRSEGMLHLAKERHQGPLALMDVQRLALPANRFEVALVAFVLFHLPSPEQCLAELNRVLRPGGSVGTVTWGSEKEPAASASGDDEQYIYRGEVFMATAVKADHPAGNH